jgi:type I restriction enzyme, S subunit
LNEFKVQGDPLTRIRNVRAAQYAREVAEWQQATAKWRATDQIGHKPIRPEPLLEQPVFSKKEFYSLPSLPSTWTWVRLGDLFASAPQNGLYKPASSYGRGTPIIRIDSFYDGAIIPDIQLKRLALLPGETDKYRVKAGDILINRVNSIEYLGKCALVTKIEESTVFESNIMKFTVLDSEISQRYLVAYLSSHGGRTRLCSNAKHAVNQASINQTDVASTPVPLPTVAEQHEIASELGAMLAGAERAEKEVEIQLAKSNALRQAILKKAFSGQLVAKCTDDEPASVLLERIRAERDAGTTQTRHETKRAKNGKKRHRAA